MKEKKTKEKKRKEKEKKEKKWKKERKKKRKLNENKERSCCKKTKAKKRTRGVTVPILNLPRPPCPVLMSSLGSLISLKICTLEIHDN